MRLQISTDRRTTLASLFVAGLVAAGAAAGSLLSSTGEMALKAEFETALKDTQFSGTRTVASVPVSGSEDYWLKALDGVSSDPALKKVAIGDEITFSIGGERRVFSVETVSDYAPKLTTIDTSGGQSRMVLVTARDKALPGNPSIRFVIDSGSALPPGVAGNDHARNRSL